MEKIENFKFKWLQFGEYLSELSYQSICIELNISAFFVVKWISNCVRFESSRVNKLKLYLPFLENFHSIKNPIFEFFKNIQQTFCLKFCGQPTMFQIMRHINNLLCRIICRFRISNKNRKIILRDLHLAIFHDVIPEYEVASVFWEL